jgi:integrase
VSPADETDVEKVKATLPSTLRAMVDLQLLTGMRPGEVRIMRPMDVDTTGDVWVYRPQQHKTEHFGQTREVLIGQQAQTVLVPFPNRRLDAFCFDPREAVKQRAAECPTHRRKPNTSPRRTRRTLGDHYTKDAYARAIHRACKAAGVEPWTPNQLRHTFATRVRKEFGLEVARVVLGHATADTTEIYAEADREKARLAVAKVG